MNCAIMTMVFPTMCDRSSFVSMSWNLRFQSRHFATFVSSCVLPPPSFLPFVIVQQVRKSCNQNEFSAGKKSGSSEHGNLSFCRTCSHLNCLPFFPFRTCRLPKISDLFPQKRLFLSCVMHRDDR